MKQKCFQLFTNEERRGRFGLTLCGAVDSVGSSHHLILDGYQECSDDTVTPNKGNSQV